MFFFLICILMFLTSMMYSTLMYGLRLYAGPPVHHTGKRHICYCLVYIDVRPKYELSSSTRFGQFHTYASDLTFVPPLTS